MKILDIHDVYKFSFVFGVTRILFPNSERSEGMFFGQLFKSFQGHRRFPKNIEMISEKLNQNLKIGIFILIAISLLFLVPKIVEALSACWQDDTMNSGFYIYFDCDCTGCVFRVSGDVCGDKDLCTADGTKPDPNCPPDCPLIDPLAGTYRCNYGNPGCTSCPFSPPGSHDCCTYANKDSNIAKCPQGCQANNTDCFGIDCTGSGWECVCTCSSACGGDVACNGLSPGAGDSCGGANTCDASCACVAPPPPAEDCTNGVDDDGDSLADCADPDCAADPACAPPPPPPPPPGPGCETTCTCSCPPECPCSPCPAGLQCEGGRVPCGRRYDDPCTEICECCPCTLCHLFVLAKRIVDWMLLYLIIPLTILMFVVGGIVLLIAGGDPGRIGQGKKILTAAVIGLVILFTAWLAVNTIIILMTPAASPLQQWHTINCPVS